MPVDRNGGASSDLVPARMAAFERKLGLAEAGGLSLSIVGPTTAMAFNVSLVVRAAGRAAPLAFVIGTVALGIVALSFVSFSKRVAHAGSAYAYIGGTFGWRWGFVAGWTLLLTYLTYAAGVSALIGDFLQTAAQNSGMQIKGLWLVSSLAGLLLAGFCAYRDVKLPIDKALYVGWVATSKAYRRLGFAELVIRAGLKEAGKETGLERTILHATKDGHPVYTRMGYRFVAKFSFYGPVSAETS